MKSRLKGLKKQPLNGVFLKDECFDNGPTTASIRVDVSCLPLLHIDLFLFLKGVQVPCVSAEMIYKHNI